MQRTIGIKVADGSFYPVLEDGYFGDKSLVLTTVRDEQSEVHIDLYRGNPDAGIAGSKYIGSLIIENIQPAPRGEPEIEVTVGCTREGDLNVSAADRKTGEEQSLSVSLNAKDEGPYDIPDFAVEEAGEELEEPELEESAQAPLTEEEEEEESLTGEVYPVSREDRRARRAERPGRRSPVPLILFVVFAVAVIAIITYLVYRAISGPGVPPLESQLEQPGIASVAGGEPPSPAAASASASSATQTATTAGASGTGASSGTAAQAPAAPVPATAADSAASVRYRIKWGDTLWDLSATYYRNPWLYPRIAKANSIENPDLIFAGTTITIPER